MKTYRVSEDPEGGETMCELLGMTYNQPVRPIISFNVFRRRGRKNPDGWGLAFYPEGSSAQVIKEPKKAEGSKLSEFVRDCPAVRANLFIAHVRRSTNAPPCHENTHPFCRELNGREYVFAHNGTLHNYDKSLELGRFKPIGGTDSEYVFCHLLKCIEESGIEHWKRRDFEWLVGKLKEINEYGDLNCLFSDGEFLFCYYDVNGHNGLCFLRRKPPYGKIHLIDPDLNVELEEVDLAKKKDSSQTGFIVATKGPTNEAWESFRFGELMVFSRGRIVYSNFRQASENRTTLSGIEIGILKTLRTSPHRLNLREIIMRSSYSSKEVKECVHSLLCRGYIRQDSRDNEVKWNNDKATFYTNPAKREEIDRLIRDKN